MILALMIFGFGLFWVYNLLHTAETYGVEDND